MKHRLAFLLLLISLSGPAFADAPLPPPERLTVCSRAKTFCATSDPGQDVTLVIRQSSGERLWSIPGWHRWLFVSDDGESVVVGYAGMNLVPLDVALKEPVLFFHHRGELVRTVTLGDLYQRKSQFRRTVSHFAWAHNVGFNGANQLLVELVSGKTVAFAANSGLPRKMKPEGT